MGRELQAALQAARGYALDDPDAAELAPHLPPLRVTTLQLRPPARASARPAAGRGARARCAGVRRKEGARNEGVGGGGQEVE